MNPVSVQITQSDEMKLCRRCYGQKEYMTWRRKTITCPDCYGKGYRYKSEIIESYFEKIKREPYARSTDQSARLFLDPPDKKFTCEKCKTVYQEVSLHHPVCWHEEITGRTEIFPCDVLAVAKRYQWDDVCIYCRIGDPPAQTLDEQVEHVEQYFKSQGKNVTIAYNIIRTHQQGGI